MNKIKCIIVDDEPLAISLLEHYVEKIPFLELVFSTENPIHALEYLQKMILILSFWISRCRNLQGSIL